MAAPPVVNWQAQILKSVGAPVTPQNLLFVNDWAKAEGGGASNNPFNTTQPAAGATSYNSVGVRNYTTPRQGINATAQTLENGRYSNILSALRHGTDAHEAAAALANSPWGTGSLVEKMLGGGNDAAQAPAPQAPAPQAPAPHAVSAVLRATAKQAAPPASFPGAPSPIAAALSLLGFDAPTGFGTPTVAAPKFTAPAAPVRLAVPAAPAAIAGAAQAPAPAIQVQGNAAGVKPHLLAAVTQAAKAAGATEIRITSGARSADHNAQVGGVQGSNHLTGDAIDGYGLVSGQWVPLGQLLLKTAGRFGLRSGDVPGFWNGGTDPVHVDDGANVRGRR